MANQKISDLTELTSLASTDLIPVVDVSDTTQSASGTTKKAQYSNVFSPVWSLLEEVACSGQSSIDFDGNGSSYADMADTTYEAFKVVFANVKPSVDARVDLRIIDNGSVLSSGYENAYRYHASNGSTQDSDGSGAFQGYVTQKTVESDAYYPGVSAEIFVPVLNDNLNAHGVVSGLIANSTTIMRIVGAWEHRNGGSYTDIQGIRFFTSSGNFASGKILLYGLTA
jgi:hypothetical protein